MNTRFHGVSSAPTVSETIVRFLEEMTFRFNAMPTSLTLPRQVFAQLLMEQNTHLQSVQDSNTIRIIDFYWYDGKLQILKGNE